MPKERVIQCYIEPVLLYECEARTVTKSTENLKAVELWFLRTMMRIPRALTKISEEVLSEDEQNKSKNRNCGKIQSTTIQISRNCFEMRQIRTPKKVLFSRSF